MFLKIEKVDLFLIAFFSGLILILSSIYFYYIIPPEPIISNHSNIISTIISLELISNKDELTNIIGREDNPKNQIYRDLFIKSIAIDNFNIFVYCLYFLCLFYIGILSNSTAGNLRSIFYLALILLVFFDLWQNFKISNILKDKPAVDIIHSIENLRIISLFKWFFLFLSSGVIGILYWLSKESLLLKFSGLFLFTSFVTFLPGIFRFSLVEIANYLLYLGLILSWVHIIVKNYDFLFRK